MTITPAQLDTLKAVAHHRNAIRVWPKTAANQWTWQVGGVPRSGTINRLIDKGFLERPEPDVVVVSAKGRKVLALPSEPSALGNSRVGRSPVIRVHGKGRAL